MSQAAKAQEPSMEEILASIRRIIADDDASKTAKPPEPAAPPPAAARPAVVPPPPVAPPSRPAMSQTDIDAVLAGEDKAKAPAAPAADILELTEAQTAPAPKKPDAVPSFRTIDGQSDVIFSDRPPEAAPEPPPARAMEEARRQFTQFASDRSLLSNNTAAAVDSAFNSLAHTVLGQNARTLEDLVKEMLRPMLKAWLDDNLPGLVERIVRAEIERVSRGRG